MNHKQPHSSIKEIVLQKVESGKITMKPKWHFLLRSFLLVAGTVVVVCFVIYVASFVHFWLWKSGLLLAPAFGIKGTLLLLGSIPWVLIIASLVFVVLLEILVKKYAFAYKAPLLYSLTGVVVVVAAGGVVVSLLGVHPHVIEYIEDHELPIIEKFYKNVGVSAVPHVYVGIITNLEEQGFTLQNPEEKQLFIQVGPQTQIVSPELFIGEQVIVFGNENKENGIIEAFGVKDAHQQPHLFLPRRGRLLMPHP
jgi:hypothetical protein